MTSALRAVLLIPSLFSAGAQGPVTPASLNVCGVQAYLGMPEPQLFDQLRSAGQCRIPTAVELEKSNRLVLISVDQQTNTVSVRGGVTWKSGRVLKISKQYPEPADQLDLGEWMIDVLSRFEREHQGSCSVKTDVDSEPEQHTRTTHISCGRRTLDLTAGSASMQKPDGGLITGKFVSLSESLE